MHCFWRRVLHKYEQAIEIAATGIGVVFLALASLTLVTVLLSRYIKGDRGQDAEASEGPRNDEDFGIGLGTDDDPMVTAAMVAAIQVVQGNIPEVVGGASFSPSVPVVGSWRSHGRQMLMQSQGSSTKPRTRRKD
tara:strand:+ start:75 stop:479 length:405 start_codon:yes stop_codon:yes gene_type:complete